MEGVNFFNEFLFFRQTHGSGFLAGLQDLDLLVNFIDGSVLDGCLGVFFLLENLVVGGFDSVEFGAQGLFFFDKTAFDIFEFAQFAAEFLQLALGLWVFERGFNLCLQGLALIVQFGKRIRQGLELGIVFRLVGFVRLKKMVEE